ncbi:MAG: hypothetical protein KC657_23225 [Myxococcales bacterium]|nr:hypothetical protein [Myxococcales bacterium]
MNKSMVCVGLVALVVACGGKTAEAQSPATTSSPTPLVGESGSGGGGTAPAGRTQMSELEARRVTDAIKSEIPGHRDRFKSICGSEVNIEIDWASFGRDMEALKRLWGNVGVQRLVDAFKHVCVDAAGKSAVKGKVKTIRAINVWDEDKVSATLSGGTFTVKLRYGYMPPGMNETDIAGALIKAL